MLATALNNTKWRLSSKGKHQNFGFFGLVPKSPIHTGLICVTTPRSRISHARDLLSPVRFLFRKKKLATQQKEVDKFISSLSVFGTYRNVFFHSSSFTKVTKLDDPPVAYVVPVVPGGLEPALCEDGDGEGGGVLVLVPHAAQRHQVGHLNTTEHISANPSQSQ